MDELNNTEKDENNTMLCDVLSDDYIGVISRNIAREYAFENEYMYNNFVEAISKGMKIAKNTIAKNVT